jgi:hypothetical protein
LSASLTTAFKYRPSATELLEEELFAQRLGPASGGMSPQREKLVAWLEDVDVVEEATAKAQRAAAGGAGKGGGGGMAGSAEQAPPGTTFSLQRAPGTTWAFEDDDAAKLKSGQMPSGGAGGGGGIQVPAAVPEESEIENQLEELADTLGGDGEE